MDPAELYPSEVVDELAEAIRVGPVVLCGIPGTAREAVARAALRQLGVPSPLIVDPARAGTLAALKLDVARELVATVTGEPALDDPSPAHLRSLQQFAGADAPRLLGAARGDGDAGWPFLLGLVERDMALVVRDAVQLRRRWAQDALWTLRGRASDDDAPRVVLLARSPELLTDPRQAFLGSAATFQLRPPAAAILTARLAGQRSALEGQPTWLTASRCLPAVVAAALEVGRGDPDAGWAALVAATAQHRDVYLRLALEAHHLGPRLLVAIAQRKPPYGSVPGAAPALTSKALSALRDADLITQPAARQWQIADPALEIVLASS